MSLRQTQSTIAVVLFAFIPVAGDWVYKVVLHPRPFWIHYYDPETIYFFTGHEILAGVSPTNIDNPGTPVQLLSAAMIWVLGAGPLQLDEFRLLGYLLAFAANLAVGVLLVTVLFRGLPVLIQIAGLWLFFLCSQSLEYNNVWSPELWYFAAGSFFVTAWAAPSDQPLSGRRVLLAGALLGFCCSLKLTFLAWVPGFVLACFLLRAEAIPQRFLTALQGLLAIVLGFVAATAIIIPRYPEIFAWGVKLAAHSGEYGAGAADMPSPATAVANWCQAVRSAKGWHLLMVVLMCAVLGVCWQHWRWKRPLPAQAVPLIVWAISSLVLGYLLVSRQMALRYLLPTSFPVLVLFLVAVRMPLSPIPRSAQVGIFLVAAVLLGKHIQTDLQSHNDRIATGLAIHREIQDALQEASREGEHPVVVYGWRCPRPSFALRINSTPDSRPAIESRYSHDGHVDYFHQIILPDNVRSWDFLVVTEDELHKLNVLPGPIVGHAGPFLVVASPARSVK